MQLTKMNVCDLWGHSLVPLPRWRSPRDDISEFSHSWLRLLSLEMDSYKTTKFSVKSSLRGEGGIISGWKSTASYCMRKMLEGRRALLACVPLLWKACGHLAALRCLEAAGTLWALLLWGERAAGSAKAQHCSFGFCSAPPQVLNLG